MKHLRLIFGIVAGAGLGLAVLAYANQPAPSPYAGQEQREIKSLSRQEVEDYLAGRGLGFAKAAELNHYPGPAHVLELLEHLELSPDQKARTQALFQEMEGNAQSLGKTLVEQEVELDRLFATRRISRDELKTSLERIGRLQAELRRVHLEAHLAQAEILTHEQIRKYDELRGYGAGGDASHDTGAHRH